MEIVTSFLSEAVRFLSGGAFWCAVLELVSAAFGVTQTGHVVRPTPIIGNPIHYAAATDEETLFISFGFKPGRDSAFVREIARIGPAGADETVRVEIPWGPGLTWTAHPASEGISVTGADWWYATLDALEGAAATTFIKSDGARATHARPPAVPSDSWQLVTIPGEEPRVIELTFRTEETIAREVDWSGASRSWQLPPMNRQSTSGMVAHALPDGRIALLSNHDGLSLHLLADEGVFDAIALRNVLVRQFDATIDSAGRLAIVAARNADPLLLNDTGTIEVAVIDPARPDHAQWRPLRHDVRVTGQFREVQVVTTPEGFAAAWINELEERRIEATDIDARGRGGLVVEVGHARPRVALPFLAVQAKGDEVLFWWDDGEALFERRLPASLSGYALLKDVAKRFCREGVDP